MDNPKVIVDQLFESIKTALPSSLADDAKDNLKAVLSSALKDLDLVTREELEVQNNVLAQTRLQLKELERMVADLELHLKF